MSPLDFDDPNWDAPGWGADRVEFPPEDPIEQEKLRQKNYPPVKLECTCREARTGPDPHPPEPDPSCVIDGDPAVLGQWAVGSDKLLRQFAAALEAAEAERDRLARQVEAVKAAIEEEYIRITITVPARYRLLAALASTEGPDQKPVISHEPISEAARHSLAIATSVQLDHEVYLPTEDATLEELADDPITRPARRQ